MRYIILELAFDGTVVGFVRNETTSEILEWKTKKDAKTYAKEFLALDWRIVKI